MTHEATMTRRRTDRRKWLLALTCLWLAIGWAVPADSPAASSEYQVKAAFLYNFTKFTDWPTNAFTNSNDPIVIGIVGDDPFGQTLDGVVRGEMVGSRPLVVKRLRTGDDLAGCQVLFLSRSEKDRLPELLGQLKARPVLTVSDISGFAELGGMVNLQLVSKTVKLEINQVVAETGGLQISAKLLKLARLVKTK